MYNNKCITLILLAGGSGRRMGIDTPKQFIEINGVPMIIHTITPFLKSGYIDRIIVATRYEDTEIIREVLGKYLARDELAKISLVQGGPERHISVRNSLLYLRGVLMGGYVLGDKLASPPLADEAVLIHDVARTYVSKELIDRLVKSACVHMAVVPCVKPKDTIRTKAKTLNRDELYIVQTPQVFAFNLLNEAYMLEDEEGWQALAIKDKTLRSKFKITDDASLVERVYKDIYIAEGEYSNIKITTKEDILSENRPGV